MVVVVGLVTEAARTRRVVRFGTCLGWAILLCPCLPPTASNNSSLLHVLIPPIPNFSSSTEIVL